jgi:peptidylamidoglycolate lyase
LKKVFKYSNGKRILTLGELFVPGDDSSHFCKPTDIVLSNDNLFLYVADGYCNSRILKFYSNGTFIKQYQIPQGEKQLFIPHSLILLQSLQLICVADRQNGRFTYRLISSLLFD